MSTRSPPRLDRTPASPTVYGKVYRASLRPVVLTLAIITAVWTLLWSIDLFEEISLDKEHGTPRLVAFAIVLGTLYASVALISIIGIIAAAAQRLALARIFAWLSLIASLVVVAAGFVRVITHFILKHDLINECTAIVSQDGITFRFGIWNPPVHDDLNPADAASFCSSAWSHDSSSEIISLILEMILAAFFVSIAWAYYRQLSDPISTRTKVKTPGHLEADFPSHYTPSYLGYDSNVNVAGGGERSYSPPAGPPPGFDQHDRDLDLGHDDIKPPGYSMGEYDGYAKDIKDGKDDPFSDFERAGSSEGGHGESRDTLV